MDEFEEKFMAMAVVPDGNAEDCEVDGVKCGQVPSGTYQMV
jgi:hypothetical protein